MQIRTTEQLEEAVSKLRGDNYERIDQGSQYNWKNSPLTVLASLQLEIYARDTLEGLMNSDSSEWERGKMMGIVMGLELASNLLTGPIGEEESEEDYLEDED